MIKISAGHLSLSPPSGTKIIKCVLKPPKVKPVFKWPGGKRWLAAAAPNLAPPDWKGRYFEPFVGGGSFYFALNPFRATLSDRNGEVIATYQALRMHCSEVINELEFYPHDGNFYYYLRDTRPRSPHTIAARFLYLNRTCWNGLYRVNRRGHFNTPFGDYSNPTICDEDRIDDAADALSNADLLACDFEQVLKRARKGNFVYCDPPYITGHTNNGFHKYNANLFAWEDQQRLARVAIQLKSKGVHVLVSNADHASVIELYKGFSYYRVVRSSLIAAESENRGLITEALLASYPVLGCKSEVIR